MPEFLTTKELAELLRIKQRKVYDLVASGKVPYSKTTGKLLFPKQAIDQWIEEGSSHAAGAARTPPPGVFLGSHDPLLDWTLRESKCGIATYFDGSLDGVERFISHEGVATGLHVQDPDSGSWNLHIVQQRCANMPVVLCHWARRMRGLIVAEEFANRVRSLEDVAGLRFVPRQQLAGAHALFLHLLNDAGVELDRIRQTEPARTEVDSALSVVEDRADFAFGLEAVAAQYRLPFVPVIEEQFDLIVDRRAWFEPGFQTFLEFVRSSNFAHRAKSLHGYDVTGSGNILYNGP